MAKLRTFVHVTDDEGRPHAFGPADEVPTWAQALITNPKAWAEAPVAQNDSRVTAPSAKPAAKRAAPRRKAGGSGTVQ
ncbi:hypothetical protein SAM23877_6105 [Streptomyces ambofaciens ATCC 23877]|uniref:Uncharacterized protein n=1 Tax=Streptomyces ambofaciens (strain ATCC 23877 / 3486 / DSM 40053 / JCM 4204 / NBRC 12836 / NRRL B-2516) TaxID=278992 RepID=A0A0K2B1A6_STRA7|nr:hypothetical protein SAM23877_6105 [Streptomyces ambofaciens ATCC 23877]WNA15343.1 putative head-tail connector protein [Streptomyces phage Samy]